MLQELFVKLCMLPQALDAQAIPKGNNHGEAQTFSGLPISRCLNASTFWIVVVTTPFRVSIHFSKHHSQ